MFRSKKLQIVSSLNKDFASYGFGGGSSSGIGRKAFQPAGLQFGKSKIFRTNFSTESDEKAQITQREPFEVDLKAGKKYFFCTCGRTKNGPFCDGSHRQTKKFIPKMFEVKEDDKYWLCGCKRSQDAPFCDGSHAAVVFE